MGRRLISVLLTVAIISGFVLYGRPVKADEVDYSNVTLAQLVNMKDDPEEVKAAIKQYLARIGTI